MKVPYRRKGYGGHGRGCPDCGAMLDPGEHCDCEQEVKISA